MRNLLRSTWSWLTGSNEDQNTDNQAADNQATQPDVDKNAPQPPVVPTFSIAVVNQFPAESVSKLSSDEIASRHDVTDKVILDPNIEKVESALELHLKVKAGVVYAICPHCSSTWNLKERVMRGSRSALERVENLTCPSCDNSVSLPEKLPKR